MEDDDRYVLIVDDYEGFAESLASVLEHAGYRTVSASCAEDAAEAAGRVRLRAVVMDVVLKGIDGFQAVEQLSRITDLPEVFYISAYPNVARSKAAERNLGRVDLIEKPNVAEPLLRALGRLGRRAGSQQGDPRRPVPKRKSVPGTLR